MCRAHVVEGLYGTLTATVSTTTGTFLIPMANFVRASRDGDQFHYLWAARRCLSLLSTQADLVGISIEGHSPDELPGGSTALRGEELIDIAEYYGDVELRHAELIRYMQLKHSSRHAAKAWTASGLEKTLIGFSERYKDLSQRFSTDDLAKRFEFSFVTNRPISSAFTEAVGDAVRGMTPRHPNELKKLERFTGLKGTDLSSFCSLIHFEERQDDYWDQRNILFQEVSGYLPDSDVDAPIQLKELVTRRALSESEKTPVITKIDVLRALKTDESRLFPTPCLIKPIDNAVPRKQEADLIEVIVQAEKQPVIVHALAGVGKSVFATRIPMGLPQGSVFVLYDCFGNGQYRSATGYRHRHRDALVQIANELAAKGLCHPLIPTVHADASAYMRAFSYRLQQAITLIRLADTDAVLCIVIDAADNAQSAAEEIGESRSFVRDLLRETLLDGVRLVILCRSHRRDALDPPLHALQRELESFSTTETATCLRQTFPDASEHDVGEFHRLTSQNPRVQALALFRKLKLAETLRLLGPNPTTVESTIGNLLNGAIAKLRDSVGPIENEQVDKICAGLAALRPLIPTSVLSQISGVSEDAIRSFALLIGRPLLLADDTIQFLDEPVETWFRVQFKPPPAEMATFIHRLKPLASKSAYVASTLPQLMLEAGQFQELVALALTSDALPEASPMEKRAIEIQRLQFALKASLRSKQYPDAVKLAVKAGGETAGDDRQREIIQANTDLAAVFVETGLVKEIVSRRTFGSAWTGSHHAYEASLLSGRCELIADARSRLRMANEWLVNWSRLTPAEREKEEVSDADIAELGMAEFNIHGARAAAHTLSVWKPREVSFRVGRIVAGRLIDHGRLKDLDDLAVAASDDLYLVLAVVLELNAIQKTPPSDVVDRAFRLVFLKGVEFKVTESFASEKPGLAAVTALAEAALKLSLCLHGEAAVLLTRYLPDMPPRGLSSRFGSSCSSFLRAYNLRAALEGQTLQLIDLAHTDLKAELEKEPRHHSSQEVLEFKQTIGALLPWHQLWAAALLGEITIKALPDQLARARDASAAAARIQYRDASSISNEVALIWFDILNHMGAVEAASIDALTSWITNLEHPLFARTLTELARLGAWNEEAKAIALRFAAEAYALIRDERADAASKASDYVMIARSTLMIGAPEAKAYFDEAVAVASKIGEENLWRWDAILDLADRASRQDRPAPEAAYRFARCAELTYDYVAKDKHFDWHSTVRALSFLCPNSSLAILSRWRDRGFGRRGRLLPIVIHALTEHGCVDPRDALALVGFEAAWEYPQLLCSVLEKCEDRSAKKAASALLFRYMKWKGQASSIWRNLKEVTEQHGLSLSGIDSYIAFAEHEECAIKEQQPEYPDKQRIADESPKSKWNEVFSGSDLTTANGISLSYAAFNNTPVRWTRGQFFAEAFRRVPTGSEATFIAAAGDIPAFDLYDLGNLLKEIPDDWKGRPSIKQNLEATLKAFCRRFCMEISKYRHFEVFPFDLASMLTGVNEADIIEVVLDAIGESPDFTDSQRLFSLVGLLESKLNHDEALEALMFGLSVFDPVLEDKDGDGPWSDDLAPPTLIHESIAGYIYAGLAAPEAGLRWEAAHAVLALCALGRHEVLRHLVSFTEANSGEPFAEARLPFYRLHALQWLLVAFARASIEFPAALAPSASRCVDWALNDQPHVMIRLFAARTALALIENGVLPAEERLVERLSRVNATPFPVVKSQSYKRVTHKTNDVANGDDEDRFYFTMNIGPYWYEPLGRVFALPQSNIETEALRVIRNELHYSAKREWHEDERRRRKIYDHEETYASHGSYPNTDDLKYYLSYHAMMIVAGRLLATKPIHCDPEYGEQDEFAEWLSRHNLSRNDGRWLADRRDPAPLEWPVWCEQKKDDPAYEAVTSTDFEEALGTEDTLNIWGHWSTASSTRVQSVHVRSALVSPDRSMALLRALSTAEHVYDYAIPSSDDDRQIDQSGFVLKGWIEDRSHGVEWDGKDHWSGGVDYPPPLPAAETVELMALKTDLDKRVWRDAAMVPVMSSQMWGHSEVSNHDSNPERGERLQASLDFVKDMLAKINHDLIIEVQIERRQRYRHYESRHDDDERIPTGTKLYLIKADGSVTTL